jgi:hypothetical protein
MLQVSLTAEERKTLVELLEIDLSDLRAEISDTHDWHFREKLKQRKQVLKKILDAINEAEEASASTSG